MTTGEGGIVVTNSKEYATRMVYLRGHAMSSEKRFWHTDIGYNYRHVCVYVQNRIHACIYSRSMLCRAKRDFGTKIQDIIISMYVCIYICVCVCVCIHTHT